jgi:hypothetical protein
MTEPGFSRSQPEVWRAVWSTTRLTAESVRKTIRREQRTLRWLAIRRALTEHFGGLHGLHTIELGAGTGDISLLMALEGAQVTLFDADEQALELAAFKFAVAGLKPDVCTGDYRGSHDREKKASGSTALESLRSSKCSSGFVTLPVAPALEIIWPRLTTSQRRTSTSSLCA